jgi:hypothetical protein
VTSGLALATLDAQKLTYEKQYYKDLAPSEIARISATRPEIGQQVAMTMSRIWNVPVAMLLAGTTQAGWIANLGTFCQCCEGVKHAVLQIPNCSWQRAKADG